MYIFFIVNVLLTPNITIKSEFCRFLLHQFFKTMAKKNNSGTDNKKNKTENLESILKRKELQNKMFEKLISEINKTEKQ